MQRMLLSLALSILPLSLNAVEPERVIRDGTELRDWCKSASEADLIGRGQSPSNWSARYWDEGNTLNVDGQWRTGELRWQVQCRAARGASANLATVSVSPVSN